MNKSTSVAYIDLLTTLFALFIVAFAAVYTISKKEQTSESIIQKAEYIITLDWPDGSRNDFDLWVADPLNRISYFKKKSIENITLDRDDLGSTSGKDVIRREITTIRSFIPGTYTVNVLLWAKNMDGNESVRVTVTKLNPFREITTKTIEFTQVREEKTVISFTVNDKNEVVSVDDSQIYLSTRLGANNND